MLLRGRVGGQRTQLASTAWPVLSSWSDGTGGADGARRDGLPSEPYRRPASTVVGALGLLGKPPRRSSTPCRHTMAPNDHYWPTSPTTTWAEKAGCIFKHVLPYCHTYCRRSVGRLQPCRGVLAFPLLSMSCAEDSSTASLQMQCREAPTRVCCPGRRRVGSRPSPVGSSIHGPASASASELPRKKQATSEPPRSAPSRVEPLQYIAPLHSHSTVHCLITQTASSAAGPQCP